MTFEELSREFPQEVVSIVRLLTHEDTAEGNNADYFSYLATHERILNASVEVNNYEPVTFDELVENNRRHKENYLRGQKTKERNG